MASEDRMHLVYKARLSEQAERYDEMAGFMRQVAKMGEPLPVEDRNLLSVAYKNSVGERRAAWRVVSSIEAKQQGKGEDTLAALAGKYRETIEAELQKICNEILDLLDNYLLKDAPALSDESRVFYYKMKGDYFRYIAEFSAASERAAPKSQAEAAYRAGMEAANSLPAVNPIRLGLILNFSVFYYEIMNEPEEACRMARVAFDEAVAGLDSASENSYRDAALIMQLLRDNLTLWTQEVNQEGEGAGPEKKEDA